MILGLPFLQGPSPVCVRPVIALDSPLLTDLAASARTARRPWEAIQVFHRPLPNPHEMPPEAPRNCLILRCSLNARTIKMYYLGSDYGLLGFRVLALPCPWNISAKKSLPTSLGRLHPAGLAGIRVTRPACKPIGINAKGLPEGRPFVRPRRPKLDHESVTLPAGIPRGPAQRRKQPFRPSLCA